MRIGHGYDVHRFADGKPLILGGISVESEQGLLGHSDADVLLHAVMDALLGAAALGDIGAHFPDTDERYRGADSGELLGCVVNLVTKAGYRIGNIDATVLAQTPRLAPYIFAMRKRIADLCRIPIDCVSVKATTEEGLGLAGAGIGAQAVVLLEK